MRVVVAAECEGLGSSSRAALALARRLAPGSLTALSAGGPPDAPALQECLRAGAARAVFLRDAALESTDFHGLGRALAAAIRHLGGADLVLAGAVSESEGLGIVPAVIAHHLGVPFVAAAEEVAPDPNHAARVLATVRAGGRLRRLAIRLPAVLSIAPGPAPDLAPEAPLTPEVLTLADLGLDPSSVLRRSNLLGALERPKRKPVAVSSAEELVARWLGHGGG